MTDHRPERHRVIVDVHLFLLDGEQVLLGRRTNTGYGDGAYHPPAGHLEYGESVVAALMREAKEEIDVTISPEDVHLAHIMHNSSDGGRLALFFDVHRWDGVPNNMEPEKCAELRWFSLDSLPDEMIPYARAAFDQVRGKRPLSIYGW